MVRKSNNAIVYPFIAKSYPNHITIVEHINNLNFITSFTSISHIYVNVLITGKYPTIPKLLNLIDIIVAKLDIIILAIIFNLSL